MLKYIFQLTTGPYMSDIHKMCSIFYISIGYNNTAEIYGCSIGTITEKFRKHLKIIYY